VTINVLLGLLLVKTIYKIFVCAGAAGGQQAARGGGQPRSQGPPLQAGGAQHHVAQAPQEGRHLTQGGNQGLINNKDTKP
jgi:hypothetical protein